MQWKYAFSDWKIGPKDNSLRYNNKLREISLKHKKLCDKFRALGTKIQKEWEIFSNFRWFFENFQWIFTEFCFNLPKVSPQCKCISLKSNRRGGAEMYYPAAMGGGWSLISLNVGTRLSICSNCGKSGRRSRRKK